MAALTWRDVAAPNFAGANQAYQGAGQTLDRALSGLSEGLKQFATTNQEGADNALLAQTMKAEDAAKMRGLLANADLSKVSPKVLETMGQRVTQLLGQASTEQSISSSKTSQASVQQGIDFGSVNQAHTVQERNNEIAAREQQARKLGITGPMANLPTADQRAVVTNDSNLVTARLGQQGQRISNEAGSFNLSKGRRDDAAGQAAMASTANALENNATIDDLRSSVLEIKNPQERLLATKAIEAQTGQRLFGTVDDLVTTGSGGKSGVQDTPTPSTRAQAALSEVGRRLSQNSSVGVVADIERTIGDTRSVPEVAQEVAKFYPKKGVDYAKLSGIISNAVDANPNLSPAEVGAALQRSTTSNYLGSTRFADGIGIDDSKFTANLESFNTGKADYLSQDNQRVRSIGKAIQTADQSLTKAKSDLTALQRRAQSQTGIDTTDAEDRVQRMEEKLKNAIERQQADPSFKPIYQKPRPVREAGRPERNRAFKRSER